MAVFTLQSVFAKHSFDLVLVHEFDFPYIFFFEFEFVILPNDLKLVGKLMGAHFIDIKQVYDLFLFADMKVPNTIQLPSETMNGLISHDNWGCTLLMIKVLE